MESMVVPNSTFWRGRRVLLTGHTGFKGSWLLLWLQELGADVWTFSREPESDPNLFHQLSNQRPAGNRWQHQIGDLADLDALKNVVQVSQPEIVLHLAAQPLVRRSYQDPIGTWNTNLIGSLHLLEALRPLDHLCAVVMITTDKVYANKEWSYGYREPDRLGGYDPYSASKAGAEIAIDSWRSSFCGLADHQTDHLKIATARAGNVIGGGDWAVDRIVPDAMRALAKNHIIKVRNPSATRPWQHVIEPLSGYLRLAEVLLSGSDPPCEPFNFGPSLESNRPVSDLVSAILEHWSGSSIYDGNSGSFHEANLLHLQIDKAHHRLAWSPRWDFSTTVARTVRWYRGVHNGECPLECCLADLNFYSQPKTLIHD